MNEKISKSIRDLDVWAKTQKNIRLILGAPLSDKEIDALPQRIAAANSHYDKIVPFNPADFIIPASYREFLKEYSYARIEYEEEGKWLTYEPFNIFSPEEVIKGESFKSTGASLDGGKIYTTFLVAFATAGYEVESSYYCFYTDSDIERKVSAELPILLESNDFECDLAKFVDIREWIPRAFKTPAAFSFEGWLEKLVSVIISKPFDVERTDEIANSFYPEKK